MAQVEVTNKDRSFAAKAGESLTPFNTPPDTPSRRNSQSESQSSESLSLPKPAFLIIFVEGCERFCFYGLKTILLLYFMNFISLNKDSATVGFHLFTSACYLTPIIGAILSDGFIGRYHTILFLSIVYFIGACILTLTAIPHIGHMKLLGPVIGLSFIALGTGGIKSSVGAFGADQIPRANIKQLNRFFALFYFSINAGSLFSTLLTPFIRSKVRCFGYDCYSLAFGISTVLMLIAIILFVLGTPFYKRIPPKENIIAKFIAILFRAIKNALFRRSTGPREHWLYYANDKYEDHDIEDVRAVLRVGLLFVPIPVFYALFDQSGSRWTYQATLMNGNIGRWLTIQPDQMQALNSLFILFFIPLFEEVLYPLFARCNFLIKPLQRMFSGMIVMIITFLVAAAVQAQIELKPDTILIRTTTNVFNGYNCPIMFDFNNHTIQPRQAMEIRCSILSKEGLKLMSVCNEQNKSYSFSIDSICPSIVVLSEIQDESVGRTLGTTIFTSPNESQHGTQRFAQLRMVSLDGQQTYVKLLPNKYIYNLKTKLVPTAYQQILPNYYNIENVKNGQISSDKFRVTITAIYTGILYTTNDSQLHIRLFEDVPSFTIHILWQTFQYILLTVAEVLVSITGLVFAYSQAPKRYKAVIMSMWFLTTAVGNLFMAFVAEVRLVHNQTLEFVLFAGFMTMATFIFGILAIRYKDYRHSEHDTEDQHLILEKSPSKSEQILE